MVSERLIEIVAGRRRVSPLATLAIALAVTALVVIPLTNRVLAAEDVVDPSADAASIVVQLDEGAPLPLEAATISGAATITFTDDDATGVSFSMFPAGESEPVLSTQDLDGPVFSPITDGGDAGAIDTTALADGSYELFVTISTGSGEQRTAVPFTVANP